MLEAKVKRTGNEEIILEGAASLTSVIEMLGAKIVIEETDYQIVLRPIGKKPGECEQVRWENPKEA
jgi:hypothetical protein